jgi:L-2-hydroxyglutarate oxidase LhgO
MAEDPKKTKAYACTYVIVCAGNQGEQITKDTGLLDESKDKEKIL